MANTYLTRTPSSSGNRKTFTFSFWFKRGSLGSNQYIYTQYNSSNSYNSAIYLGSSDNFLFWDYTNAYQLNLRLNRLFRDVNAWYHIVIAVDTTQATASNRAKIYINGVQETSFSTATYPSQNLDLRINEYQPQQIGISRYGSTNENFFDGSMSHFHFIDGTAYPASAFGSTDSTTGEWKINTSPSVTYGTNGYFILKDGNTITDSSPNSNNFSLGGGTLTKTEDCPSNVFATMNALSKSLTNVVLSKGNTVVRNDANSNGNVLGTIALGNGKYYWETYKHGGGNTGLGLTLASVDGSNHTAVHASKVQYYQDGYIYQVGFGLSNINTGVTYADTDIIGVSVDTENGTIKFYKNGALVNNSSQTNSVFTLAQNELIPFWYVENGGELRSNLGNGYFGTTAVSSAGTNASGNGIFEYAVPTGYTALSTKGLNL